MLFSSLCSRKLWRSLVSDIASRRDHGPDVGMQCRVGMAAGKRVNSTYVTTREPMLLVCNLTTSPPAPPGIVTPEISHRCCSKPHSFLSDHITQEPAILLHLSSVITDVRSSRQRFFFFFCLEPLKFSVQITCDFSNFAATGSLLSDSRDNTPTREHTGPVWLVLQCHLEHG